MRARVSFLVVEGEGEEEELEDLEQPVKRNERIKQKATKGTKQG
jgi:hypothetical protein